MKSFSAFLVGSIFGLGLLISEMVNPAKVIAFLDVTGNWDPSLALVMASALIVTFLGYRFVLRRPQPFFEPRFFLPTRQDIDARLVGGSALFGIGWGLAGLCPGPALSNLSFSGADGLLFAGVMVATMWITRRVIS